jgi:hypothetical protein
MPNNRQSLLLLCLSLLLAAATGCGGAKEATKTDSMTDSTLAADTAKKSDSTASLVDTTQIGELDFVQITTDERVNPVRKIRDRQIQNGGFDIAAITDDSLGCKYTVPKEWQASKRVYKNLVNYFGNNKISVTVSVARPTFDSVNIWAQVQEAIAFGKNQLPKIDWTLDSANARVNANQTYFGRYEFKGRQYNLAFFRRGDYQYNVIIDHPLKSLTEEEAQVINYIAANFSAGIPKIDIPKPVPVAFSATFSSALENVGDVRFVQVAFKPNSSEIPLPATTLDELSETLTKQKDVSVSIFAYADDSKPERRPPTKRKSETDKDFARRMKDYDKDYDKRTKDFQKRLAEQRAKAVFNYVRGKGIALSRLKQGYDAKNAGQVVVKVTAKAGKKAAKPTKVAVKTPAKKPK